MQRGRAQAAGEGRAAAEGAAPPLVTAWLLLSLLSALRVPGAVTHAVARLLPFSRVDGAGPAVVRERLPAQLSATLMVVTVGVRVGYWCVVRAQPTSRRGWASSAAAWRCPRRR